MKRVACYVRVSTLEQRKKGLSVDSQIIALENFCKENDYVVAGIYNDAGISARKKYTNRPALLQLIEDCKAGKIDLIAFTRLDRYFRNIANYYEVQSQIDAVSVPWRAIWEDYETETSAGVFKVNIMLSIAQAEADRTSERIKAVNEYKRERGDYVGRAPMGYKRENNQLIKDPGTRKGFEALFDTYLKTFSIAKAQQSALKYGVSFDRHHLYKLMVNTAYCGEASGGYKCEPYITKEDYELIRKRIGANPRKPKKDGRVYLFSGLLICGYCGSRMSAHTTIRTHANGEKVEFKKYDCQRNDTTKQVHPHIQVTESNLEAYLLDHLDKAFLQKIEYIKAQNESLGNIDCEKQKKALEAKLKRLAVLYEEGDIDVTSYREKRDSIKRQIVELRFEPLPEPKPLPEHWKLIYEELDDKHRQDFWRRILKSVTITNESKENPDIDFL